MKPPKRFMAAFGRPAGLYGGLAALAMAVENRHANRAVVDLLRLTGDDIALDVGCGPGMAARHAARAIGRHGAVIGLDRATVMVRAARVVSAVDRAPRVRWLRAGVESVPLGDDVVTVAYAINSFHHWNNQAAGLRELVRVVRPGGRIVLVQRTPGSGHPGASRVSADSVRRARDAVAALGPVSQLEVAAGRDVLAVFEVRLG